MESEVTMNVSRRKATAAGHVLRNCPPGSQEYQDAIAVMLQWREQHIAPTQESFRRLLEISKEIPGSVATYRLKRQSSILAKLTRRGNDFELGAIDDIGGCRLIVDDMRQVEEACRRMRDLFPEAKPPKNYIERPESSGYRSYHDVVQMRVGEGRSSLLYRVEIQIRTKLQHYWSTTVEAAGEIYNLDLKTPKPEEDCSEEKERRIRDSLRVASAIFAMKEGTPMPIQFKGTDVAQLAKAVRSSSDFETLLDDLEASDDTVFPVSWADAVRAEGAGLYLLEFSRTEQILNMRAFPADASDALDTAVLAYQNAENAGNNDGSAPFDNVVLVYARNPDQLKLAYPNYSSNVQEFVAQVKHFFQ
ncbi:RelA/SpoT domain-containing protein [Bifidobacterium apri]